MLLFDYEYGKYSKESFIIMKSNFEVYKYINFWPNWKSQICIIVGPKNSGKTHLTEIWREKSNAKILEKKDFSNHPFLICDEKINSIIIENFDFINEKWLFDFINFICEKKKFAIITTSKKISEWNFSISDLNSRLSRMVKFEISSPKNAELVQFIKKIFLNKGIKIKSENSQLITTLIHRDFSSAINAVNLINEYSSSKKKQISKKLINEILYKKNN